jgi:hypothetical protein
MKGDATKGDAAKRSIGHVGGGRGWRCGAVSRETTGEEEHTSNDVLLTQTLCFIMNISCCSGRNVTNSAQPRKKFSRRRSPVAHP